MTGAAASTEPARPREPLDAVFLLGRAIFALSMAALGIETWVCAELVGHSLGPRYAVLPVLPWLPAIDGVAYIAGATWVLCGVGLLFQPTMRRSALLLGGLLFLCAVILDAPKYAREIANVGLRTTLFEPLALASLAFLVPGRGALPGWLAAGSRYLIALCLIVFGVDHFIALAFIATLLPAWIPWHVFWTAFFGIAFIAAGLSFALDWLLRPAAFGIGLMFAIWVVTLHLPRVLGLYGIPGAPRDPNEWSSLIIAVGLWGGLWAMARVPAGARA